LSNPETKNQEASPKIEIASDTVKTQLASVSLELTDYKAAVATLTEENQQLKQQNIELASVIENQLKTDKIVRIQAASKYSRDDLSNMTIEQLQTIEETLSHSTSYNPALNYKSIRAGNASSTPSRLTVGDLYGKSAEEIRKMEGL